MYENILIITIFFVYFLYFMYLLVIDNFAIFIIEDIKFTLPEIPSIQHVFWQSTQCFTYNRIIIYEIVCVKPVFVVPRPFER